MADYVLTMDSTQARETLKAVELLMRLKLNQPEEISRALLEPMWGRISVDESCKRRDKASEYLRMAFLHIFPTLDDWRKDREFDILYNLYQSLRYAICCAETPDSTGVNSDPPRQLNAEPIPLCVLKVDSEEVKPVRGGYKKRSWECGSCHTIVGIVGNSNHYDYCCKCGRKIDWSVESKKKEGKNA